MLKNKLFLALSLLLFCSCANWPWKFTEQHGKNQSGSIFDQISNVMEQSESPSQNDRCSFVPDSGLCKGAFEKFYFNQESQKCDTFNWGGCNGLIPFESLQECIDTCE